MMTPAPGPRRSARAPEHVADAADRMDERGVRWIGLDPAAQPMDVDVDRARLATVVVAPYVLEQLVAGEDLARVADQEGEQLECLRLDRDDLPVTEQPMAAEIGLDRPEIDDGRRTVDGHRLGRAAEQR